MSATKTEIKQRAQETLMNGIATVLGYWSEQDGALASDLGITEDEFRAVLGQQADRVARLFGYDEAWSA